MRIEDGEASGIGSVAGSNFAEIHTDTEDGDAEK